MPSSEKKVDKVEWLALVECASPRGDSQRLAQLLPSVNWRLLLEYAEEHSVIGLLSAKLRECDGNVIPTEIVQQLRERRRKQQLVSFAMTAQLFRLLEQFAKANIGVLLTKGPALSVQAYGDPGLRQYGDLDLLVRHRDIYRASEMMMGLGYEADVPLEVIQAGKIPGEYVFTERKNGLLVELHTEHTLRYFPRPISMEGLFQRQVRVSVDAHEVPTLSVEDELVMICVHGAKDLWERLLWVADVAALVSRQQGLDWKRAQQTAREVKSQRMLQLGLRLASDLLQASLPEEIASSIREDGAAEKLAAQVRRWLPAAGTAPPSIFERALFRMRLSDGLVSGPAYLLRLSLSPTEEDWSETSQEKHSVLWDAVRRPFRLARKYGQDGKN